MSQMPHRGWEYYDGYDLKKPFGLHLNLEGDGQWRFSRGQCVGEAELKCWLDSISFAGCQR